MSLGNIGDLGDLGNLDLGQLQQFLPDLNFPAGKEEVLSTVQSNGAPQEVIDQIRIRNDQVIRCRIDEKQVAAWERNRPHLGERGGDPDRLGETCDISRLDRAANPFSQVIAASHCNRL